MNGALTDICRRCRKRLVIVRYDDGRKCFYNCMGRDTYAQFVRNYHQAPLMRILFALDPASGKFLSPFEEFRDIYWRPVPYVENRKVNLDDEQLFRLIGEDKKDCEMYMEMQMAEWNEDGNEQGHGDEKGH